MSYNHHPISSRSTNTGLRLPLRSDSSPSISPTSTAPHVFPSSAPSSTVTTPYDYSSSQPPLPSSSTTARFHEALAAYPTSSSSSSHPPLRNHRSHTSISSIDSNGGYDPLDTATSPFEDHHRAFDVMQRELGATPGQRGLGLMESRDGIGGGGGTGQMSRVYEEPEEFDRVRDGGSRGRSTSNGRGGGDYDSMMRRPGIVNGVSSSSHAKGTSQDLGSGVGRPASMDLDNSMSFLLSPPPSSFDSSKPSPNGDNLPAAKPLSASTSSNSRNGRSFPVPLLLKGSGSTPSSPNFNQTAPLSIPRRPSASNGSLGSPSLGQSVGRSWGSSSRMDRGGGGGGEREGTMGPPSSSSASGDNRSKLPYQRHRSQQSSTSSLSQGSYLPYHNSYSYTSSNNNNTAVRHGTSASASTISTASPALGQAGSSSSLSANPSSSSLPSLDSLPSASAPALQPTPSAPTTSTSNPTTPSSEPPISSQALLLHIHSLRSAASPPMSLSQSQGPLPRSPAPFASTNASQPQNHQRIRSAGSTSVETSNDASTTHNRSLSSFRPTTTTSPNLVRLDTVDLSHKRIAEVPPEIVEELQNECEKLALGYNLLKDLPSCFVGFGARLKYLNVRVNLLTTFPAVLCEMPSIEILDISRNKIRKLPQNPGTLVNLKVFSIAKNRVKRLPTWFTSMSHLKVLKLDHNPLEWPPKEITTFQTTGSISGQPLSKQDEADEMQRWLPALMRWMRENKEREIERERERDKEKEKRRKPSNPPDLISEDERPSTSMDDSAARHFAMPRTESGQLRNSPSLPSLEAFPPRPRPRPTLTDYTGRSPPVTLDTLESDPSVRHSRNASHSLMQSLEPGPRSSLKAKKSLPDLRQSHADILAERRTGAPAIEEERVPPDLPSFENGPLRRLQKERPALVHSFSAKAILPTQSKIDDPSPPTSTTTSTAPPLASTIVRSESARPVPRSIPIPAPSASLPPLTPSRKPFAAVPSKLKRVEVDRANPSTFDRNSGAYFRRQSMLPPSTIAKAVPAALLQFADAIRGILFALSQIYSALRQFVVFASQDRLPAAVARLMGSADQATNSLINALDRFDSLSRRGLPPQAIVRAIFTTCRDNVSTFGQLVAEIQEHLQAFTETADVRYTRTLLLMLYGSMGEIANSWSTVVPLFPQLDQADPEDITNSATLVLQPPTPSPTLDRSIPDSANVSSGGGGSRLTRTRSVTRRHAGSFSVEDVQLGAVLPPADIPPVPAIPASSSLDEAGLSDYGAGATVRARPSGGGGGGTPKSSFGNSKGSSSLAAPGSLSMPPTMHYQDMVQNAFEQPLTPGGTGLFDRLPPTTAVPELPSRSNSSYPLHTPTPSGSTLPTANSTANNGLSAAASSSMSLSQSLPASASVSNYNPHRESRPVSTLNADETFVDQADSTIQIAFDVYGMLLDSFDDPNSIVFSSSSGNGASGAIGRKRARELSELCKAGNETTARLKRGVERVRGGDGRGRLKFTSSDARRLGDASFDFVQTVIKFARAVKTTSTEVSFPSQVREGVGQLTLATREFAKLLSQNQTSFRPTEQPQPSTNLSSSTSTAAGGGDAARRREGSAGLSSGGGGGEVKVRDYAMV